MSVEAKRKIGTKRNDIVTTIIIQKKKRYEILLSRALLRDYRCPQHFSQGCLIKSTPTYIYVHKSCL